MKAILMKNMKKYWDPKKNIQEPGRKITIEIEPAEHESGVRKNIGATFFFGSCPKVSCPKVSWILLQNQSEKNGPLSQGG